MIRCQNCGQVNAENSNFCRFCGNKFKNQPQPQVQTNGRVGFEHTPPRPYAWKTDEFQVKGEKQTKPINRVQPLISSPPLPTQKEMTHPSPYSTYSEQNLVSYGYRCPRCSSQLFPKTQRKISAAGWIVFTVLLLTFFPLFWIGFLIKEEVKICPVCNVRVS